jgi:integrase
MGSIGSGRAPGRGRLYAIERNGVRIWRGEWSDARGARHRVQLGTNRADAERALSKVIRDRDLERFGLRTEGGQDVALDAVFDAYLVELKSRARSEAVTSTDRTVARLRRRFASRRVRDVSKAVVQDYRRTRLAEGAAASTVNHEVALLKAALACAERGELIGTNPLAGLRSLPVKPEHRRRVARALNEGEITRLLAAAEEMDRESDRFPAAVLVRALIVTGARWSEMISTTWQDLDESSRPALHLRPDRTKTGVGRSIPLSPDMLASIQGLRRATVRWTGRLPDREARIFRRADGKPWSSATAGFRGHLLEAFDRAGIQRITPEGRVHVHALRHTFATRLARAGVPIQHAQLLTGHRSIAILAGVYTHLALEDARDAIAKLPPLPAPGAAQGHPDVGAREATRASGA